MNTVTLFAVGDIMLGNSPLCINHGVGSIIKKRGFLYPFSKVSSILKSGDIVFGNLEAVLSNHGIGNKLSSLQMRASPQTVVGLSYAGLNVLSLANNHILEHGEEALYETMMLLARHGINYVGVATDTTKAREPLMVNMKGIGFAFLAYCLVPDKTAYITITNPMEICRDVRKIRSCVDVVVVSLHWGNEYVQEPSPSQVRLAHQIVDAGANLVLGHHPHVVQPVELYKGAVIAYSLGNFVFDMTYLRETRSSVILECQVTREGVADHRLLPLYIDDEYVPFLLNGRQGEVVLAELRQLSSQLKEDTLDFEERERAYERQVDILRRRASRRTMMYFVRNIYRYPPRFTVQILLDYLGRHLSW